MKRLCLFVLLVFAGCGKMIVTEADIDRLMEASFKAGAVYALSMQGGFVGTETIGQAAEQAWARYQEDNSQRIKERK